MANKTRTWTCDTCGKLIEHPRDGCIEWIQRRIGPPFGRDLRLVHYYYCQFDAQAESAKDGGVIAYELLTDLLKPDGLGRLLRMISVQELPVGEVITMIHRLRTPGYELAYKHVHEAAARGFIQPVAFPDFYAQAKIDRVLAFVP